MSKPTPRLANACLIKAMDGNEKAQAIWKRWMSEPESAVVCVGVAIEALGMTINVQ